MIGAETHPRLDPQYRPGRRDSTGPPPSGSDRRAKHAAHPMDPGPFPGPLRVADIAAVAGGPRGALDPPQAAGYAAPLRAGHPEHMDRDDGALGRRPNSSSNSQNSNTTDDADRVFTPAASQSALSVGNGNDHSSSQESQLQQLSQLAAAQEKMPDVEVPASPVPAVSRKRMADGMVKDGPERLSTSPVRSGGHSRNTSTLSIASTSGSRIGEVSLPRCVLRTRTRC